MNAPPFKSLRIIGKRVKVRWNQKLVGSWGEYHINKHTILLSQDAVGDQLRETLLHEIIHAVSDQVDAELPESKHRQISIGLYAAMRDNKGLAEFLFSGEDEEPDE